MPTAFKNRSEKFETLFDTQHTLVLGETLKTIENVISDDSDAEKVSGDLINHCKGRGSDFLSDVFDKLEYEGITGKELFQFYKFSNYDIEEMLDNISYDHKIDSFKRLE